MRIGLEISPLAINSTGIPNYILRLLRGFAGVGGDHEFLMYTNRPIPFPMDLPDNFRTILVNRPVPRFQLWFQLALPGRLKKDGVDIFHGLFSRLPLRLPVPGVITAHDLSGYSMPGMHKRWTHLTNLLYPNYIRSASGIIAVSKFTASEVGRFFPAAEGKTSVVYEAAPPEYSPVDDAGELERVRNRYGLPDSFILFLGTLEPRKNLPRLLKAFQEAAGKIEQSLVIAGGTGWKNREMVDILESSPVSKRIRLTGFIEDGDVPGLMSLADLFVYPSLYEGFGLPILEAMACGTPVITSTTASMPEVAGDAALLADPNSVGSMAEALERMAGDPGLRAEMTKRGLARASEFSWERAATETLDVYRRILAEGRA